MPSAAHRRSQRCRPHPGPPAGQPTPRRAGAGAGTWREARGSRREARGARARRGRAASLRTPWSARPGQGAGGRRERAPRAASASYFLSRFLLEGEGLFNSRAVSFSCLCGARRSGGAAFLPGSAQTSVCSWAGA